MSEFWGKVDYLLTSFGGGNFVFANQLGLVFQRMHCDPVTGGLVTGSSRSRQADDMTVHAMDARHVR